MNRTPFDQSDDPQSNYFIPFIIEQTGKGERGYDIWSRLLVDRIVFLNTPIFDHVAGLICAQMLYLDADAPGKPISFYINSPGGYVSSAFAIYDTMRYIKSPVSTLVMGQAASAGSLLLTAGEKGQRYSLPNARIMTHQPSGGMHGQVTDIEIHAKEIVETKTKLNQIYADLTGRSLDEINAMMERDRFFSPEQAKEFGLIDSVVSSKK
jgi:ATP-dependent Clp protease protease subunit